MGERTALKRGSAIAEGDAGSSLEALSRTLEALESRLAGATRPRPASIEMRGLPVEAPAPARPSLADAVSQIVMRRQMLDGVGAPEPDAPAHSFAAEVDELRREDASLTAAAGIAEELRELRGEIQAQRAALRPSDMRLDTLRQGYNGLREAVGGPSAPTTGAQREIAVLEAALAELAAEGADEGTISALRSELSGIREIVSAPPAAPTSAAVRPGDEKRSVPQELERLRASFGGDPAVRAAATEERLSSLLTSEMNQLREKIETLASERSLRAVEERWQAMEGRFASRDIEATIAAMAERMAQLETALARLPETLPIGTLQARIESLAAAIDTALLQPQPEPDDAHFVALEERLEEISRAIAAVGQRPAPMLDMAPIERIETRMSALSSRLDALSESVGTGELSERVEEIALRLDAMAAEDRSALLAERLERFGEAMQRLLHEQEQAKAGSAAIEERLSSLSERLDQEIAERVDPALVRSLEDQIARLSIQLSTVGEIGVVPSAMDEQVDERLSAIERRLDENRDAVIATARAAADEAVARLMEAGERRQSEHVAQLSEALRSLEALSAQNDKRMAGVVDAVHETLLKIVERLDQIEDEMAGAMRSVEEPAPVEQAPFVLAHPPEAARSAETSFAPAAEDEPASGGLMGAFSRRFSSMRNASASEIIAAAPALESPRDPADFASTDADSDDEPLSQAEANRPLDIGSGTPDIAALISRVRAQQRAAETAPEQTGGKADFIAAARRHAMAAAAEVDSLRSDEQLSRLGYGRVGDVVSRRRQPILMAGGAVLLALMAMPLGVKLIRDLSTAPAGERIAEVAAEAEGKAVAEIAPPAAPEAPAGETPVPAETTVAAAEPAAPVAPAAELMQPTASRPTEVVAPGFDLTEGPAAAAPAPAEPAAVAPPAEVAAATAAEPAAVPARQGPDLAALAAAPLPAMPDKIGPAALTAAAQNGNSVAMFEIGLRLMEGATGEPKPAEAVRWFEQAAGRGFAPAQYSLGTLFEKGNGVSRDTVAARDWYTLAADQGNVRAMHNLAVLYATGVDGVSQPETAAKWFTQAADYGMRDSQYNLGILYARGAGVPQDMVQSYKWFAIVAASGDKDAADKREEVRQSLSPEQRTQAEAAVAAWSPKSRVESANTVDVPQDWSEGSADTTASVDMTRAVRNIQIILGKLGYDAGAPDGKVGARTTDAIRSFQSDSGLEATGEIDETLIRALLARKDA